MDSPRCASCRHWDPVSPTRLIWTDDFPASEYGECEAIPEAEPLIQQSFMQDTSTIYPVTHKTFGCVLWEAKEE